MAINSLETKYSALVEELKRLSRLSGVMGLLEWDEQVNLPKGAAEQRAGELSALAALVHREWVEGAMGSLLAALETDLNNLSFEEKRVVADATRDYGRATCLPESFVVRRAQARSRAYHAWEEAREEDNFSAFEPHLSEQLDLARQEASLMGWDDRPYDYWLDQFDWGMTTQEVKRLFAPLEAHLPSLAANLAEKCKATPSPLWKGFDENRQEQFLLSVLKKVGFDFRHGRLDRSVHPFCAGNGNDTRLTTRFHEDNPLDSLYSSLHEAGHGMYEQGLPKEHLGTALGKAAGMAVHESQSRIWENQIARSRPFWTFWEPQYRHLFGEVMGQWDSETFYRAINRVEVNPIRVDSDEVTYNLHILLRFDLEQRLFEGSLSVRDLPEAWSELSHKLLGFRPKTNRQGVLQDVHWSGGGFGYFPSYCLGNMLAAQLWETYRLERPEWETDFSSGDFSQVLAWLRDRVHRHGMLYDALALSEKVTGHALSSEALLRYLKDRYGSLWGL